MKLILLKSFNRLGKYGEVVTVANGYARNYLIPMHIAIPATKTNLENFELRKLEISKQKEVEMKNFDNVAEKMHDHVFYFIENASEDGKLFGSISSKKIAKVLSDEIKSKIDSNFQVKYSEVEIPQPIKYYGFFHVFYGNDKKFRFFISVGRNENEAKKNGDEIINYDLDDNVKNLNT